MKNKSSASAPGCRAIDKGAALRTGSPRYSRLTIGATLVAQVVNLLYGRWPVGGVSTTTCSGFVKGPAPGCGATRCRTRLRREGGTRVAKQSEKSEKSEKWVFAVFRLEPAAVQSIATETDRRISRISREILRGWYMGHRR